MSNIGVQLTCSMEAEDPPDTVLRRANDLLDSIDGFGSYNIALNNCFDFACYCKIGGTYFSLGQLALMDLGLVKRDSPLDIVRDNKPTCVITQCFI